MKITDERWALANIRPDPENPRRHSDAHVEQLRRSIVEFGFTVPLVIDATGKCLAGHGRLRAANLAGLESVPVRVHHDLTPEQARAYLIADNALGEGSDWDLEKLGEQVNALKLADFDLSLLAIDPVKLDALTLDPAGTSTRRAAAAADDGDEDPSPLEPSAAAPWVKDGQLFAMGAHRLFVGDSLVAESRARLLGAEVVDCVITDPPYAIYGSSSGVSSSIADDAMVIPFFEAILRACAEHMREFAHGYLFHDWRSVGALYAELKRVPALTLKNNLVWDKKGSGLGSNYANTYENVLFFHRRLQPKRVMKNAGERSGIRTVNRPNVIRHNRPSGEERLHNAAKPVPMLLEFVEASTDPGQIVWDPCCGSGSTLIACEKSGRACRTGELNPATAQVAIERWQRLTGKRAEVVEG